MKKLFVISLFVLLGITLSAQKVYRPFAADTVKGNETIYFTPANEILYTNGLVGFFFKANNVAGTVDLTILQGSYNGTDYIDIDTIAAAASGNYFLYDKIRNSITYSVSTSDTVTIAQSDTLTVLDTTYVMITDSCGTHHDTSTFAKYGSNQNITGTSGVSVNTSTATITINDVKPVVNYLNYRLLLDGGSGDTCIYNPMIFIYKEEER